MCQLNCNSSVATYSSRVLGVPPHAPPLNGKKEATQKTSL